jgi:small subunit ribosomal protein S20
MAGRGGRLDRREAVHPAADRVAANLVGRTTQLNDPLSIDRGSSGVANIKSQIKRNRQNEAARVRNKAVKSELKTAVRRFREAADGGDASTADSLLRSATRLLDKAASKGVIHKNQAANRKSALAAQAARISR